ncbi:enolase C-terminal domain-like protein [Cohnella algarum]|uniref:enolase C-terminal domain-like protein n=1 Tax=Cohnella algarum TaxID=2044859 RepID=UPI001967B2C4|nr:mandelate racemase/muconate lactonizing enzyme family protein [Cohnella algarum]
MRIHKVDCFPLFYRLPKPYGDANGIKAYRSSFLVRLTSDSGVEGWGECSDWLPALQAGFRERIIPYLTGKPVADRAEWIRTIAKWHARAAAAVSMAATEMVAKSCGISVCELWGGKLRDKVPVYASFQSYSEDEDWEAVSLRAVEAAINEGFPRLKLKIGGKTVAADQRHIRKVQALLQEKSELALDANGSYDVSATLQWQFLLETWPNMLWLEEPIPAKHPADYRMLRQRLRIPIAGGENVKAPADYIPLLTGQALDIVTPDPLHLSGIDRFREAGLLARSFGLRVSPHAYDGVLSRLYALFAQACLAQWSKMGSDSIEPVEWDVMDNPFSRLLDLKPNRGEIALPSGAGIGAELDLELIRHYQWDGSGYGF